MIPLSPDVAFLLYLGVTLTVLLLVWLYQLYRAQRRKLTPEESKLTTCAYCHFAYLASKGLPVSRCPQCRSYNKDANH